MDEAIELIKSKRNISENSIKSYRCSLKKVLKLAQSQHFDCLDEPEKINKILFESGASPASIRAYLASICVLRSAQEKDATPYKDFLAKLSIEQAELDQEHKKSQKEENNWMTMNDLLKTIKIYENNLKKNGIFKKSELNKKEYDLLQRYVVGMLYVGDPENHPPVRCDYSPMRIISKREYEKIENKNENYLINKSRNKKTFAFHNFKTMKTHGAQLIDVSPKINSVLNKLLKFNKGDYLLTNSTGLPMSTNCLSKFITKTFSPTGKNISVNLLRHFFISENKPPEVIEKYKNMSEKMLHTEETQNLYSKK